MASSKRVTKKLSARKKHAASERAWNERAVRIHDAGAELVADAMELQHGRENLQVDREHGREWVTCKRCGRQFAIHGNQAEVVSEGDGYCGR